MRDVVYLAWRYLAYNRFKTAILVASITLIFYLPIGLQVLVSQSADRLTARASATPLLVGTKGSPLELVLNSLYFESETPELMTYSEIERVARDGLADPIPLHARFRVRGFPIVGTTLDYFQFRDLRVAQGEQMAILGECVLGHVAARELGVTPGSSVTSSPETAFDLAGVYPLRMRVAGVLEPSDSPDDRAVFVDLKTAWVIEGRGHGHQDLSGPEANSAVLSQDEKNVVGNASVVEYQEITPTNAASFHFHGDRSTYPLTAVIAVPRDEKAGVILRGYYESETESAQIVRPDFVMEELLETVLAVQRYVVAAFVVVGFSTLATSFLVFVLSLRLRRREIETMIKIGGSRKRVAALMATEIALVVLFSLVLGAFLTALTAWFGAEAIRAFLVS